MLQMHIENHFSDTKSTLKNYTERQKTTHENSSKCPTHVLINYVQELQTADKDRGRAAHIRSGHQMFIIYCSFRKVNGYLLVFETPGAFRSAFGNAG